MTPVSYAMGILSAGAALFFVIELLRRRRLRERHAVWWLFAGTLALVASVFPLTLEWAARLLGIAVPTNLVFFISIGVLVLVCLQHSSELTRAESRTRDLAEEVALLNLEVATMRNELWRTGKRLPDNPEVEG